MKKKIAVFLKNYAPLFTIAIYLYKRIYLFWFGLAVSIFRELFSKNPHIITSFNSSYFGDNFATTNYVAFLHDEEFLSAYYKSINDINKKLTNDIDIKWRCHIVTWAVNQTLKLEGDMVECGTYYGALAKCIAIYNKIHKSNKKFYLVDTWGDPKKPDLNHPKYQKDIFEEVKIRFKDYKNVVLVRGHVPEILDKIKIKKICFLSIDMNGYKNEKITLEKYYHLMVPGGIIYFDDYGWGYEKLREVINLFFKNKPEKILHFPSGNSIVIKK